MKYQEVFAELDHNNLWYLLSSNTINMLLMDLYLSFQDSVEEDGESRDIIRGHIKFALEKAYREPTQLNKIDESKGYSAENHDWDIKNNASSYINRLILPSLNYIVYPDSPKPDLVPDVFKKMMDERGIMLDYDEFFRYR